MSERTDERRAKQRAWYNANKDKVRAYVQRKKDVRNARRRERYATDEDYRAARRLPSEAQKVYSLRRSGYTPEIYERALEDQDHKCAICKDPFGSSARPCADHCHSTGLARGVLCDNCNVGLGRFRDDPDRLRAAIEYLANPPLSLA